MLNSEPGPVLSVITWAIGILALAAMLLMVG